MQQKSHSRRRVLAGGIALAGAAAMASCAPDTTPGTTPTTGGASTAGQLPDTIVNQVKPDLPAASPYGMPGYLRFPSEPASVVSSKPLSGETVSAMAGLQGPSPTPMASNSWWQAINDVIGGTLELQAPPGAEYTAKLSTMVAGNDLPDMVQVPANLPRRAEILPAVFTELGQYLGGDKIAEYGQLANLSADAWRAASVDGGIYGVPMPLGFVANRIISREDLVEGQGLTSEVSSADEFFELCQSVTVTSANQWALCEAKVVNPFVLEMFGAPNEWQVTDQGWVRDFETDEYLAALEYMAKLWQAGVIHPDAFGNLNRVDLYKQGRAVMITSGGAGMVTTYNAYVDVAPDLEMGMVVPPRADGSGQAAKFLGTGINSITAIPASLSEDQVHAVLRVLNVLGAGFGTKEYLAVQYGAEGKGWEWQDGIPTPLPVEKPEKLPVNYLPGSMSTCYYAAGHPEIVQTAVDFETALFEGEVVTVPTVGLNSVTESSQGGTLMAAVNDSIANIIQGRETLNTWTGVVDEWRKRGGDKIRHEYEEAAAAAQ